MRSSIFCLRRVVTPAIGILVCLSALAANAQKGKGGGGCVALAPINPVVNACFSSTAQSGCIDSTFGNGGAALLSDAGTAPQGVIRLQAQADGTQKMIVAVGGSTMVARFNLDGTLDTTFGSGGVSTQQLSTTGGMNDILIDAYRNILMVGSGPFFVMRLLPDGGLDTSFASSGVFNHQPPTSSGFANATAVAVQPDGKIVVVGAQSGPRPPQSSLVLRLNSNGTLDSTFGSGGITTFIPAGQKNGGLKTVALQSVGSTNYIVAAGTGDVGWLGRLTPAGVIDSTFGSSGQAIGPACGGVGNARAIYVDGSNNIFLLGYSNAGITNGPWEINLSKYKASGVLDTSFGDVSGSGHTGDTFLNVFGGTNVPGFTSALTATTDSTGVTKLVVTGQTGNGGSSVLARYSLDGTLDPTFGGGVVARAFGSYSAWGMGSVVEPNGEIVPLILLDNGYLALTRYWP